ncbi:MAG: DUF72 domain-containing protein [Polyangiaceae bacterium]
MSLSEIAVATAGWSVPHAVRDLCCPHGSGLQKYASVLNAVEINSTFYRRHQPATFERWSDNVPASFRFAVKLPRSITHDAALLAPRAELKAFFEDIRGLGPKQGPVLVQLPASQPFHLERVGRLFGILRELYSGLVACEPRHAGWYDERAHRLFMEHEVARVIADPPRPEAAREAGGSDQLLYVRWHGSPRTYWSPYSDERLTHLVDLVLQRGHRPTWCVFDNTASGAALPNALRFRALFQYAREINGSRAEELGCDVVPTP